MGTYTVQKVTRDGVVPTENAVAASDTFKNDGKTILLVTNGSGFTLAVTIVTPGTVDGLAIGDRVVDIADGTQEALGPFQRNIYNDSDGEVTVNYDAITSVTAAVLKI